MNEDILDQMQLPRVNKRREKSKIHQHNISILIDEIIQKYEKENDYKFETYEIDHVLLNIIKSHHKSYLRAKFGCETIG